MTTIILIALFTLAVSFLCSTLEATLYSLTMPQLDVLRDRGVFGAERFSKFRADVGEPIAAILTVNTIANVVGAAICGGLVAERFGDAALGVFSAIFTVAVLALAEIVPKSIGVRFGKSLVPLLVWPLQILIWVSLPIARTCSLMIRRLTRGAGVEAPTDEEIIAMSKQAARVGELTVLERTWVENALRLDEVSASDLLTPRTVVQFLSADRRVDGLEADRAKLVHSRMPVTEGDDLDRIVGVVYRRDLFDALAADRGALTVRDLMHTIDFVPETIKGPQLLDRFIRRKRHMVAVIDEYGGFEGLVTLEDVMECMLGVEIVDEHDEHVDMQAFAREQAKQHGAPVAVEGSDQGEPELRPTDS